MSTVVGPIQKKRGTAAALTAANPVLLAGEEAYELDTGLQKRGDGATAWTALAYLSGGGSGAVSSVAGRTGAVTLTPADVVGLPRVNRGATAVAAAVSAGGLPGWWSVAAYGATGNGVTDDTAAVRAAVAAAAAKGGTVYFPPGDYLVYPTGGVCVPLASQAVSLVGAGPAASRLVRGGSGDTVRLTGSLPLTNAAYGRAGVRVRDLGFANASAGQSGWEIAAPATRALVISGCVFAGVDGCVKIGTPGALSSISVVENCSATDFNQFLRLVRVVDVWVLNCSTNTGRSSGVVASVHLDGGVQSCNFLNCDFIGGTTAGSGISLDISQADYTATGLNDRPSFNQFTNCYFDSHGTGLYANSGGLNTFTNCWFSNRGAAGARVTGSAGGFAFVGCQFANNDAGHGLWCDGPGDVEVSGGFAVGNAGDGVRIDAGTGYRVRGVRLGPAAGSGLGGNGGAGLRVAAGADFFVVKDNDARGNTGGGIVNAAGTGATKIVADNL